jgi:predicted ATPase
MAKHRIVITGGGGSGKSSLIEFLIQKGYCAIREAAREQIRLSLERNSNALPWEDIVAFSELVHNQMILDYHKFPESQYCFYDRGLLDVLSYLRLDGREAYPELKKAIDAHSYFNTVFILPPWREIFTTDDERMEDFEQTVAAFEMIRKTYRDFGYEVVEIPKDTIERRADFILEQIQLRGIHVAR